MRVLPVLEFLACVLASQQTSLGDCVRDNDVKIFPEFASNCCKEQEMLIKTKDNEYRFVFYFFN